MTAAGYAASVMPYSLIVGQEEMRRALEISFVDPGIGVLASGQRGTAKSTTIRAFSLMAYGSLPVTMPIGATDDRVIGGLSVRALLQNRDTWQPGLIEQASDSAGRMLYIDEVNLLDDHLVNVILDAASTGLLVAQRDNIDNPPKSVRFALVGTMNPDEGGLRPQLFDRFGLVVLVDAESDIPLRRKILKSVLQFEDERDVDGSKLLVEARRRDAATRRTLEKARTRRREISVEPAVDACARLAAAFQAVGHRGDATMLRAARAVAALEGSSTVDLKHVRAVAKLALIHRRPNSESGTLLPWDSADDARIDAVLAEPPDD
jgi:magnesium chelatase subunit I